MSERFLEQAEELARAEVDAAVARARTPQQRPIDFDGTCECGNEIPEKRVSLGYYRCVECQRLTEERARRSRR